MGFGWDNPIKVEIMKEDRSGTQIVETTPKKVISSPNRHRSEDIVNAMCAVLYELVLMNEAQAATSEEMLKLMKPKQLEKKSKVSFKRKK